MLRFQLHSISIPIAISIWIISVVNRLVYGILTAALFLGSCQLLGRNIPPLLSNVSVPGAAGCLVAIALGVQLSGPSGNQATWTESSSTRF